MNKIPKLRFPEFSGEWEEKKGEKLYSLLGGNAFNSKDSQETGIKWVKISNVGINKIENDSVSYLPESYIEIFSKYILEENDIVIALTRPILNSKLKISKIDNFFNRSLLNQRVAKVIPLNEKGKDFIYYILQKKDTISYLENKIAGTDPPNLSNRDLLDIPLFIPSLPEQEEIASFLSSVDSKIEKLERKKELWEQYKKGIMQKIFSQELRFKNENGEDYPEWEDKELIEIIEYGKAGGTPKSTEKKYYAGKIPFLSISDMTFQGKFITKTEKQISEEGLKNSSAWKVPINSLIYSMYASVGLVSINKIELCTSQAMFSIIPNKLITLEFLYYFLTNQKNYISKFIETGTQGNLSAETIRGFGIKLPHLSEQTQIADFLSSLDSKIEIVEKELEGMKEFKKGLLQKMFV